MRPRSLFLVLLLLLSIPGAAPQVGADAALPDTPLGRHLAAYLEGFNSGDEARMRKFFLEHIAAASLAERGVEPRLERYRDMKADFGSLRAAEVESATPQRIALIVEAQDERRLRMVVEGEPAPPHGIVGIRLSPADMDGEEPPAGGPPMTEAALRDSFERHLDGLTAQDRFSGVVMLEVRGRTVFAKAFGLADRRHRVPNRLDTRFNIGSINKLFTKAAIGQLAQEGRLQLSDPIGKHLPDYPNQAARRVTIQQLLEHRGGMGDIFTDEYEKMDKSRLRTIADFMRLFENRSPEFEPGTRREYSNAGYVVLGAIIEKVSGRNYYDYVRERIYDPAKMMRSDSYEADLPTPDLATGYTRELGPPGSPELRENSYALPGRASPAGGGYTTAADLVSFAAAMREGRLLEPAYAEWFFGGPAPRAKAGAKPAAKERPAGAASGGSKEAGPPPGPLGGMGAAGGMMGLNAALEIEGDWTLVVLANLDPPIAERTASKLRGWIERTLQ